MTQEEILEGNKAIAEFIGAELLFDEHYNSYAWHYNMDNRPILNSSCWWSEEQLQYHTSFDWLIPVGTKIFSNEFEKECIPKGFNPWYDYDMDDIYENQWNLDALFPAIVDFIEWYNDKLNQQ